MMMSEHEIREALKKYTEETREHSRLGDNIHYELGYIRAMRDVLKLKEGEEP